MLLSSHSIQIKFIDSGVVCLFVNNISKLASGRLAKGVADKEKIFILQLQKQIRDTSFIQSKERYWYSGVLTSELLN